MAPTVDQVKYSILSGFLFFLFASPLAFQMTGKLFGSSHQVGLVLLHSILFTLIVLFLMIVLSK